MEIFLPLDMEKDFQLIQACSFAVERVLMKWGWQRNSHRKKVVRAGQEFVLSETLGQREDHAPAGAGNERYGPFACYLVASHAFF